MKYQLKYVDQLEYIKFYLKKNYFFHKRFAFIVPLLLAVLFALWYPGEYSVKGVQIEKQVNFWVDFFMNLVIFIGLLLLIRYLGVSKNAKTLRNNPESRGDRELHIDANTLTLKGNNFQIEYKIEAIKEIIATSGYYYLHTDNDSAIIVPKRAVSSQEEKNQIEKLAEKYTL